MSDAAALFRHLPPIVLASSSPRRRVLLEGIGLRFDIVHPDIDESLNQSEMPVDYVKRMAREKAEAVATHFDGHVVIGSDTTVVLNDAILAKPGNADEARTMLRSLSGSVHTVFTGVAVVDQGATGINVDVGRADVYFRSLDDEEISAYIATGSSFDKAGGYGIQDDFGAVFIDRIEGDYYTVVGLPLSRTYTILRSLDMEYASR